MKQGKPGANVAQATTAALLLSPLTKREQEVLELVAFGLANKEIAHRLSLSRRTVESHIDHVLGKLNAPTRARAVVEAGRAGLLGAAMNKSADTADSRPNNLPFQLTTLLGREQDLDEVKSLLEAHRLVTLSGSGGVGKTRLALRVGVDFLDYYPHGAWLCDLSQIADPILVATAVAKVLVVGERPSRPLVDSIVESLKRKKALLIFDNCEHVLNAAAELVDEILHNCPNVRILATSRQALGIMGEVVYRVRSLSLPDSAEGLTADQGLDYGAIALFVDRAQSSDDRFSFSYENAPIIAEICGRLDGIPLAIELAATRSNIINLQSLARSLDDRFKVLTAGGRTALPRHKTLAALIDWSYELLTPQEKTAFNRLGIFAGGFGLAAARAVCGGDGLDDIDVLDLLASLADKSLVVADTRGAQERFRMLESTRAYALEKLAAGGEQERVAHRHTEYFRELAKIADNRDGTSLTFAWLDGAELELDNYRAALEWGLRRGRDAVAGASIAGALVPLWYRGGLVVEGTHWIEQALERIDAAQYPQLAARLWRALAQLTSTRRSIEAGEKAASLYESAGDGHGVALAACAIVHGLRQMGRLDEASEYSMRALTALRTYGDLGGAAMCLNQQGLIASARGELAKAHDLYAEALAMYRKLGDELGVAALLINLAELDFAGGHPEQALRFGTEALEISAGRRSRVVHIAIGNSNNALYQIALADFDGARASALSGLRSARHTHDPIIVAFALQTIALLVALSGQTQSAAKLIGYVDGQFRGDGYTREPTEKWAYEKLIATLQEHLSQTEMERLAAEGAARTEEQVVEEALQV